MLESNVACSRIKIVLKSFIWQQPLIHYIILGIIDTCLQIIIFLLISDSSLQPAFFAFVKPNPFTLTGINDVVKFDDVTVNRGNGYDPSTGVFTAPRKGLYHISCSIMAYSNHDVHFQLNKNDAAHTYAYSNNGGHTTSTINAIVEMKKGDRVFIKHRVSKSQKISGSLHSTFSGYFMQE